VEQLLNSTMTHLESAARAWSQRHYMSARRHYLKAAENLFQAAENSPPELRLIRLEKAEQLLELARRLDEKSPDHRQAKSPAPAAEGGTQSFLMHEPGDVTLADVAGLEEAKEQIRLRMIYPLEHPEKAARLKIQRGGGVLLYGPPGTGKTLLARAVAGEVKAAFFTAKPSELMSKWVGEAEQNIARMFEEAHEHERAVIFLDEVEAMIPARHGSDSTVMQRVVPQILAELQGVRRRENVLLFMGATNEPWSIDPAALRPGRFDAKVYVGLPELGARRTMLDQYLANRPLTADIDLDSLAEKLANYSGADIAEICQRAAAQVFLDSVTTGTDRDITIGDVDKALKTTRPSVSNQDIERYQRWANTGGE
jgi:transitional endoplasmic reticulum ATPase